MRTEEEWDVVVLVGIVVVEQDLATTHPTSAWSEEEGEMATSGERD